MSSTLVINRGPSETRIALLQNDVPVEFVIERVEDQSVVGNIYCGRVVRILPGMQAAFVEVGLERTGFLYVDDALLDTPEGEGSESSSSHASGICDVLNDGELILVQVRKAPLGTKGARLTRQLTIPGRYLVYLPRSTRVAISRRIEDPNERERLSGAIRDVGISDGGFVIRTAAEGVVAGLLEQEARLLHQLWLGIKERFKAAPAPSMIFEDLDIVLRSTRDYFADELEVIVVDDEHDVERIRRFVDGFAPEGSVRVCYHNPRRPIFDHFGIEFALDRALDREVWLRSGGYIVIDQAEALTVIDVNSGRYVGKSSLEDTVTQINLEAVKEIAYQLRLRNIGGIVIVDFIDMELAANRERVLGALEEALSTDRAKTAVIGMSDIGLVEITRKRVRESLGESLMQPCSMCGGRGVIKSERSVASGILRAIARYLEQTGATRVLVNMNAVIADFIYTHETAQIEYCEALYSAQIIPVACDGYGRNQFEIVPAQGTLS